MDNKFICMAILPILVGCSMLPDRISRTETGIAEAAVESAERTVCRDIPIGTWIRLYGANPQRVAGWQAICFNPVVPPTAETK